MTDIDEIRSFQPGTTVIYTAVRDDPKTARLTTITSEPWQLNGGQWMVNIDGVRGGVSVQHLVTVPRRHLDEAHARTQEWLDKFQGIAAAKEIELLKWRSWALKILDPDSPAPSDEEMRKSIADRVNVHA